MTTVLAVRRGAHVVLAADGQVTLGNTVLNGTARKVRDLADGQVLAGFAGSTADAMTLFGKFEAKLKAHPGHLARAAVELAKEWRTDKYLRNLEALLLVADKERTLVVTGNGDVLEPDEMLQPSAQVVPSPSLRRGPSSPTRSSELLRSRERR